MKWLQKKSTEDLRTNYIASTDNCIHDGSTVNTKSLDIVMTYLGHFKIQ